MPDFSHTLLYFRGLVTLGNVTYGIEPMDPSPGSKHILYRLDDVKKEPTACGVATEGQEEEPAEGNLHPSMTQLLRVRPPQPHTRAFVSSFKSVEAAYQISWDLAHS